MEEKIWEKQHENVLKNWAEIGASYSWMHDRAYRDFKVKNMYYAIPVIILSTITGTANFAQESIPKDYREIAVMLIGGLNLLSGLITTLGQFFKINELQESHRVSNISFSKFSRNISVELNLPINDRISDGATFVESCRAEYNRLLEQSQPIPTNILILFNKKFKHTHFGKPSITHLSEITVYKDNNYEEKINIKNEINLEKKREKDRLLEHQKTMKNLNDIKREMSFMPTFYKPEKLDYISCTSKSDDEDDGDIELGNNNGSCNVVSPSDINLDL
tara:strand:- start:625 stop:1452 length:828 start_codon:yes stop_codon:yes gene_type:complete